MEKNRKKYGYFAIFIVVVIAIFALYQYKNAAYAQLDAWKLIPRQERFTELYFNDHINLPKQIAKGEKITFSFVIHNLEGTSTDYPYSVYFKSEDGSTINIEEKTVTLADGESKTIDESYISALPENKGEIYVELQQKQQAIGFILSHNQ